MERVEFKVPLQCTGGGCTLPHGYMLSGGRLSVSSRHHGQKHKYVITIDHLLKLFINYGLVSENMLGDIKFIVDRALDRANEGS